jgi:monofunctional glycosyltransferase
MEQNNSQQTIQNENKEISKLKFSKKLLIGFLIFDLIIVLLIISFFVIVPTSHIKTLKKGHIQVDVVKTKEKDKFGRPKTKVEYKFVAEKPKNWVDLKDMNYTAIHAIVVSEDWAFYQHSGYDVNQIKEAAEEVIEGERTRGASTISQQLVKNIFLSPDKELSRKAKELGISVYMERNLSKEKILETYLNVIEFGPGVYGIKAAAQHYFKKEPKDLNAKEGAFLAMLLPNPKRNSQSFRAKELTPFAQKRIDDVLEKMSVAKYLRTDQVEKLKKKPFQWEKNQKGKLNKGSADPDDPTGAKAKKAKRRDDSLYLEENPEFDEDAIIEDMSGFESEFSVE